MLPFSAFGDHEPDIFMLHWLGGSAKTWMDVGALLERKRLTSIAIDLPGFGRAADFSNFDIAGTVEEIITTIIRLRSGTNQPWVLAGHSMGGKFAAIIARAALDGREGLENLKGVVLVSPSPPSPEPMNESTRQSMMQSLGESTRDEAKDRKHAEAFVDDNVGKRPIGGVIYTRTVDDVLRMNRSALIAWLAVGSKEDWADRVGVISLPSVVLAGTEETALGPEAQRQHTLPHFPNGTLIPLQGAGHLAPIERPAEVAERIHRFLVGLELLEESEHLDVKTLNLIDSQLTSPQTRSVLKRRLEGEPHEVAAILTDEEMLILRSVVDQMVPECPFDLSSRIDGWLAMPRHKGWRHDSLPPDREAWRIGLASLDAASVRHYQVPFVALDSAAKDRLLTEARDARLGKGFWNSVSVMAKPVLFTAAQMSDWFADLMAQLTRMYIADPRTMARIGFTGFADEGGFTHIRLNEREDFEQ